MAAQYQPGMACIFGLFSDKVQYRDLQVLRLVSREMHALVLPLLTFLELDLSAVCSHGHAHAWASLAVAMGRNGLKYLHMAIRNNAQPAHAQQLLDALAAAGSTTMPKGIVVILCFESVCTENVRAVADLLGGITWCDIERVSICTRPLTEPEDIGGVLLLLAPAFQKMQSVYSVRSTFPWTAELATAFGCLRGVVTLHVPTATSGGLACSTLAWPELETISMDLPCWAHRAEEEDEVLPLLPFPKVTHLSLCFGALPMETVASMFPALQELDGMVALSCANLAGAGTQATVQRLNALAARPQLHCCWQDDGASLEQPTALLPNTLPALRELQLRGPFIQEALQGLQQMVARILAAAPQLWKLDLRAWSDSTHVQTMVEVFIHAVQLAPASLRTIKVQLPLGGGHEPHNQLLAAMAQVVGRVPRCEAFNRPQDVQEESRCSVVIGGRRRIAVLVNVQRGVLPAA